ncbi:YiiX/YebB-like N1pC/P60 family cysteine hydrolase [Pseudoxanthomonas sp. UTMC 1351]|uniref:YiiX/YebB-like N1pC/P60 family cysteine hydrolase n=1 Tax=Pseudoxanthomonas sp. UTMC 1351 TaxID=2695853 RepID=UPI0034CD0AFD
MTQSTITLIFSKRRSLGSMLIRYFTWSRWSHVGLVAGDRVIESIAGHGVREVPLASAIRGQDYRFEHLPCANPAAVIAAARSQLGKPYDIGAIFGFLGRRNWQGRDAWFCSELIAWAFEHAGAALFRADRVHRVTPEHLWMLTGAAAPQPVPASI